jgi:hypothetical protein
MSVGSNLIIKLTSMYDKQKQELSMAAMFVNGSGRNEQSLLIEDLP